jgi:hypothetical protein
MKIPKSEYVTIKIKVHQCPDNGAECLSCGIGHTVAAFVLALKAMECSPAEGITCAVNSLLSVLRHAIPTNEHADVIYGLEASLNKALRDGYDFIHMDIATDDEPSTTDTVH